MKRITLLIALVSCCLSLKAQDEIWLHPNRGQWEDDISYKIQLPAGVMYLETDGFTYDLNTRGEQYAHAHEHKGHDHHGDEHYQGHVVKTHFLNAQIPTFEESNQAEFYENYIIGQDSTQWRSFVYPCQQVTYHELYPGINMDFYDSNGGLKYDLIVEPGADISAFQVKYEGQNELYISESGQLVIVTSTGTITEGTPYAYQVINGIKQKVECAYALRDDVMQFVFPEGYDHSEELLIDPDIAFSTFTGAGSDNWGMTACPDVNKNLIAAGIVFGDQYPITTGSYDASYNGGQFDIGITKFNATGSSLIYSTFLGGSSVETPHSLIVNDNNELYIFGATSSLDFPVGSNGYQQVHNGGPQVAVSNGYLDFQNGSDLFISKLNASGAGFIGGTFLGGTSTDGLSTTGSDIAYNYSDAIRGEIMVDDAGNIYITSVTQSTNFPVVGGFQASLSGPQDAVVAKFNSLLSVMSWSTYLGGNALESGNSVQVASNGDIFVAGGTTSSNFPNTAGQLNASFQGGNTDGYVTKFNAPSYNSPKSTYLGTNDYDQVYFVQLDIDDYVYTYGQTRGSYPVTAGTYSNPNSGQFIHKISNDLTTTEFSSTWGASSGGEELSPTAFLVSDCYEIYVAGWGGQTNSSNAPNSSSNNMPLTSDAYQSTTSGNNFYLGVFTADMAGLKYGTYMGNVNSGPGISGDHVDGGTSRFDKTGRIYHAVCAACGTFGSFPTTPGVYSPDNGSSNCNMAAFLFDLNKIEATLSAASPVVCMPDPVVFVNTSQNGNQYFWDFGDNTTSTDFEPTHFYANPGTYTVMLVVSDASGCYTPDTAYMDVTIQLNQAQAGTMQDTICPGTSVQLFAIGGDTYSWGPANLLDDPSSADPIATIYDETTFTVDVTSVCGNSQVQVTVYVYETNVVTSPDQAICIGESANLSTSGGGTYSWEPPGSLDDPTSPTPIATPNATTDYIVTVTTPDNCIVKDTTQVWVDYDLPFPVLEDEFSICKGASTTLNVSGGTSYLWSPNYNINDVTSNAPTVWPHQDTTYYVTLTNACGSTPDSTRVNVIVVNGDIVPDTTICPGGSALLWASGGVSYNWSPSAHLTGSTSSTTVASPEVGTLYQCIITDDIGCKDTQFTYVSLYPMPQIQVSPAVYAVLEDTIQLWANGNGIITWGPDYNISCIECTDPYVWPETHYVYTATITDDNGCTNFATVPIYFDPLLFVPNAFTPNGDSFNQIFKAEGKNILEFQMLIFNRWGELIKTLNSLDEGWDGTYKGVKVKDDVYVWQVRYLDIMENPHTVRGHVVVLK